MEAIISPRVSNILTSKVEDGNVRHTGYEMTYRLK